MCYITPVLCFLVCVIMSSVCPPAWPTCDVRLQWLYASQERAEARALEMEAQMRALHLYVDSLEKLSSRLSPSPPPSDDDNFISGESPPIRMCKRRKFNHSSPQDKKKSTPKIEKAMTNCKNKQLYEYLQTFSKFSQSGSTGADWSPLCAVIFVLLLIYIFRRIQLYYDSSRAPRCGRDTDFDGQ